jgi:hypothetical protein
MLYDNLADEEREKERDTINFNTIIKFNVFLLWKLFFLSFSFLDYFLLLPPSFGRVVILKKFHARKKKRKTFVFIIFWFPSTTIVLHAIEEHLILFHGSDHLRWTTKHSDLKHTHKQTYVVDNQIFIPGGSLV